MSTVTYDPQDTESGSESQPLVTVDVSSRQHSVRWLRRAGHCINVLTVVSVVVGIIVGLSVHAAHPGRVAVEIIALPGELFLRMLKMLISLSSCLA